LRNEYGCETKQLDHHDILRSWWSNCLFLPPLR